MILIGLGANLSSRAGAPAATLRAALGTLAQRDVAVENVSSFYRSAAWPDPQDPEFVNAVASVSTELSPAELLACLKDIERSYGRATTERNAPRPLDLDILDYDGMVENGPPMLPHPHLNERGFVLIPLRDVAPRWRHPVSGLSVMALIEALPVAASAVTRLDDGH
jgi:2-amino-4-hydroxy-6-hydroxymethyldihydropteridine diphosphokinase